MKNSVKDYKLRNPCTNNANGCKYTEEHPERALTVLLVAIKGPLKLFAFETSEVSRSNLDQPRFKMTGSFTYPR